MKINIILLVAAGCLFLGAAGGSIFTAEALVKPCPKVEVPPCPDCNCPAAVSLQAFDLDKLNNKRGQFTYSPQVSDVTIHVGAADSVWMKQAIMEALKKQ